MNPNSFRSASAFKLSMGALAALLLCSQPASADNLPAPGSFVSTPPDMTYYARQGDTLSSIAREFTSQTNNWRKIGQRNKISNDRQIPIGSAILIPLELLPEEPSEARVVALAGNPGYRNAAGADGELKPGTVLQEGSEIHTGKNGFVTLALIDDSRIAIPSNSDLSLAKLRKTRYTGSPRTELALISGKVESKVTSLISNKGRFEVRTPLAIAGVRGTRFRVGLLEKASATEVLEGGVAVNQGNSNSRNSGRLIPAGQGNLADASGVGQAVALLPAPQPNPDDQLQLRPTMLFQASPVSGAVAYHAQIARDQQGLDILMERSAAEPRFKFDSLDDGQYLLRLTAIDRNGLEGLVATQAFSLQARPEPPFTTAPKNKVRSDQLSFVWTEAAQASAYHLQVAKDKQFSELLIDQNDIRATQWDLASLPSGHYFWRVATIAEQASQHKQGPYSDVQEFSKLAPQAGASFQDSVSKQISFSWAGEPGQVFLLQIARDPAFRQMYLEKQLSDSHIEIARPDSGDYFIRVRATDPDGYTGQFSTTQKISVAARWVSSNGEAVLSSGMAVKTGY